MFESNDFVFQEKKKKHRMILFFKSCGVILLLIKCIGIKIILPCADNYISTTDSSNFDVTSFMIEVISSSDTFISLFVTNELKALSAAL